MGGFGLEGGARPVLLFDAFWPLGIGGVGSGSVQRWFSIRESAARCLKFSIVGLRVTQVYKEM